MEQEQSKSTRKKEAMTQLEETREEENVICAEGVPARQCHAVTAMEVKSGGRQRNPGRIPRVAERFLT